MADPRPNQTRTILVAVVSAAITASLFGAVPAISAAFDAQNAHKVDGKHAVACNATAAQRKGKLVATCTNGRLPNNIILQAPDAANLGGIPASDYVLATNTHRSPLMTIDSGLGATSQTFLTVGPITYSGVCEETANPNEDRLIFRASSSVADAFYLDSQGSEEITQNSPDDLWNVFGTSFALNDDFRIQFADGSYQLGSILAAANKVGNDDCAAALHVTEYDAPT